MAKKKTGQQMLADAQASFLRAPVQGSVTGRPAKAAAIPASRGIQTMNFSSQPSRPSMMDNPGETKLRQRALPTPTLTTSDVARTNATALRTPRIRGRGRGVPGAIANAVGAYALGAGAATPQAVVAEREMRRRERNKK